MNTLYLSFALPITLQLSRTLPYLSPFSVRLPSQLLSLSLTFSVRLSLLLPLSLSLFLSLANPEVGKKSRGGS